MSKANPILHVFLVILFSAININLIKFIIFDKKANAWNIKVFFKMKNIINFSKLV